MEDEKQTDRVEQLKRLISEMNENQIEQMLIITYILLEEN